MGLNKVPLSNKKLEVQIVCVLKNYVTTNAKHLKFLKVFIANF